MCGFRGHAIELEDRELLPPAQRVERWHTQVEAAEVETFESCRDTLDSVLERPGEQRATVVETGAAAVASAVAERDDRSVCRHVAETRRLLAQMESRHPDRGRVAEHQLLDRAVSVARDRRQALLGDREDAATRFRRPTAVEHAELESRHVLLDDRVHARVGEMRHQRVSGPHDDDAGPSLPCVGLHHDRQLEPLGSKEGSDSRHLDIRWQRPLEKEAARDVRAAQTAQDLDLRLADEAASQDRRVGRGEHRQAAMLRGEREHVKEHGRIGRPRWPEFPVCQTHPRRIQKPAAAPLQDRHTGWMRRRPSEFHRNRHSSAASKTREDT